eukprot:scaffold425_cov175-Amphora_coffeaeformis.AAC.72
MAVRLPDDSGDVTLEDSSEMPTDGEGNDMPLETENLDWVLPQIDHDTTEAQSMREELHRLQVLKNYLILDADREEVFERLTGLASRIYNVPIALISLVDLGRQWFLSNRGLGDVRETPRRHAFCAHAILNKHNILIVPNATLDFRFKDNPLVTGPPNIRFYAGAPLLSPEGYKLGTFCIIDDKPRPAGLSKDEQTSLRDLADMAVREMVDRRVKMRDQQNPAQLIAYTAHDLMTPLTGVQLSLSLLKDDEFVSRTLGEHQLELLTTAANCSDLMIRICQTAIDTLREECTPTVAPPSQEPGSVPITRMGELVKSLAMIMEPIPKTVPMVMSLDKDVPPVIVSDDLKLFRSALNLLSNAVDRTRLGVVWLRIFCKNEGTPQLVFECTDTGPDVPVEQYQYLFRPSQSLDGDVQLGLSSVGSLINSLDGEYGFSPLGMLTDGRREARRKHGSIFWFSIPLHEPENAGVDKGNDGSVSVLPSRRRMSRRKPGVAKAPIIPEFPRTDSGAFLSRVGSGMRRNNSGSFVGRSGSGSSVSSNGHRKFSVAMQDPFHASALRNSCFRDVFEISSSPSAATPGPHFGIAGHPPPAVPAPPPVSANGDEDDRKPAAVPDQATGADQDNQLNEIDDSKPAGRKKRALVIEDSLVVRKSLARALDKLGYEVTQAENGLEGLKRLKEKLFDLTLCDFLMPVMDGMDCVKQYRDWEKEHRPWFSAWIVGISAHANANDGGQGITAGMNDFKPKPVSIKDLTAIQASEPVVERSHTLDVLEASISSTKILSIESDGHVAVCLDQDTPDGRKRPETEMELLAADVDFSVAGHGAKRMRLSSDADQTKSLNKPANPVCLMATDKPSRRTNQVLLKLEHDGWKVVVVNDGNEAFRLLKMRNWDAVLIDDDLPLLNGAACIESFRDWEEENRVNKQRNTFLVCSEAVPAPTDTSAIVQQPTGFDFVLNRPLVWADLDHLLKRHRREGRAYEIVVRRDR